MNRNIIQSRPFQIRSHCENVEISPMSSIQELISGSRLLHDNYVYRQYIQPQKSSLLYLPYYFSSQNILFTAKSNYKVIGTIGVLTGQLPVFSNFADLIDIGTDTAVELGSLSISKSYKNRSLFYDLYVHAILHAIFKVKADHIFIQVEARKASFYQKLLFTQVGKNRVLKQYNNIESVLMHLDLRQTWQFLKHTHESKSYQNFSNIIAILKDFEVYDRYKSFKKSLLNRNTFDWTEEDRQKYNHLCNIMT
ncbi:N-acyl amino acid synthase FeeM domain-containing protein [Acinetobacter sp. HY1485]|uniref:N-acyl amino acid synthase FeeM domain-containing protein n=1 Tax=Acinetobacter sp. HY1485 TaxID=2970918 RepID=UPI0022B9C904|nr:hypothetical protein [Acinetobacter sp. HY1485]